MELKEFIKAVVVGMFVILAGIWFVSVDWETKSYSGSMSVLRENGSVVLRDSLLVYGSNNVYMTKRELESLSTLSKISKIFLVNGEK